MEKEFVNSWKRSVQPRKQVKFRANAPLHIKRKFISARLSKELTKKYGIRSIKLRKGDKVRIAVGTWDNLTGKIDHINTKLGKIYIEGTERTKTDGTKSLYPIEPSNVIVVEFNIDDKKRKAMIERKQKK